MTRDWSLNLPQNFNRRFEDDSLVFWKPGITIWTLIWNNDKSESAKDRLAEIKGDSSPNAFDAVTETGGGILRYAYRLKENSEDLRQAAFYCFAIGREGHVQMAVYFDSPDDLAMAESIWRSLAENLPN